MNVRYSSQKWSKKQINYFIALLIFCLLVIISYRATAWSMVSIWIRSDTFTHGFLIFPIVCWLIWGRREYLKGIEPKPGYWGLLPLSIAGFTWLLGHLVDALVVQQFAWVALLISGVWVILGSRILWALAFPLAFLFFLVPTGEDLVPPMMKFTAAFTIWMVKLSGVPVYSEGLFISLPSGNWSVVEACSGVRYLIASVTLGCLYAYLTYSNLFKRSVFILISILVPVIANGLRAYMIVMLGHISGMKLAVGVDHLIYGWVFFGLVMLVLFSIGSIYRDKEIDFWERKSSINSSTEKYMSSGKVSKSQVIKVGLLTLAVGACWPLLAYFIDKEPPILEVVDLKAPTGKNGWLKYSHKAWSWKPVSHGADAEILQFYEKNGTAVGFYLHHYLFQRQGAELVNSQNQLVENKSRYWRVVSQDKENIKLNSNNVTVNKATLVGPDTRLLVWSWFRVGDIYTANGYVAKLLEGFSHLSFGRLDSAKIIISVDINGDEVKADQTLQKFLDTMMPDIERVLDLVVEGKLE